MLILQKIIEFKDFSRLLSDFPVLFKADIFSRNFKKALKIQVLFKPVQTLTRVDQSRSSIGGFHFRSLMYPNWPKLHLVLTILDAIGLDEH